MNDPAIRSAILAANAAEAQQAARNAEIHAAGEGAALALAQMPVFEMVELVGQLALVDVNQIGHARVRLTGVGSIRAYTINLPVDWLRNVIAEHDKHHEPPPEGEPDAVPGERTDGGQPLEEAA